MAQTLLRTAAAMLLFAGCSTPENLAPDAERELSQLAATKDDGGVNGDNDYCDGATACDEGEGDCDSDDQCKGSLVCGDNLGSQNGLDWNDDVCVPASCTNGVQDGNETAIDFGGKCGSTCGGANGDADGYCIPGCPCSAGEGDCDIDADCATGLVCGDRNGPKFGLRFNIDVCVVPHCENGVLDAGLGETAIDFGGPCGTECGGANGQPGHCYPGCECAQGEGRCTDDIDCETGLVCGENTGPRWGFYGTIDTCEIPHCANGVLDADETAIDYGGADCGTACPGTNGWADGYCLPGCECGIGEGDCDSDEQCATGLICAEGNGSKWGQPWVHETCAPPHCTNGVLDAADGETAIDFGGDCGSQCPAETGTPESSCYPGCECLAGQGQCLGDQDCAAGLVCATNRGDLLDQGTDVWYYDVCWFTDRDGYGDGDGDVGGPVPANLANDGTSVAFAENTFQGTQYTIAGLNDSVYGDNNAWRGRTRDSFAGIQLGTPQLIASIAFGRSNDPDNDSCQDGCTDAWEGTYTLQYTVVASPDETTPDTSWTTIDTLIYPDPDSLIPTKDGWIRHAYRFAPVFATGVRILTESDGQKIVIDELEVYAP